MILSSRLMNSLVHYLRYSSSCSFYYLMISLIKRDVFQMKMLCFLQSLRYNVTSYYLLQVVNMGLNQNLENTEI